MSTRRIYLEGLKETDENADKKIYAGNNYSGYNRVSIRRKRSLYVKKLFAGFFSIIMILGLSAFYGSGLVSAHDNAKDNSIRYKYYKSIQIHCQMIMSRLMIILQKWKRLTNFLLIRFRTVSIWWFHIIVIINSLVFFKTGQIWYICWKGLYIIYSPTAMNEK